MEITVITPAVLPYLVDYFCVTL